MSKIIFLDIDETINSISSSIMNKYRQVASFSFQGFNPIAVGLLRRLVDDTGAKIVLSSTWRLHYETFDLCLNDFEAAFEKHYGWPEFPLIGMTPALDYKEYHRGWEIFHWLQDNPTDSYVILDDSNDMLPAQMGNFVRVDARNGFDFENFRRASIILGSTSKHFLNYYRAW